MKNLEEISKNLKAKKSVIPITVRELLSWFDVKRRGGNNTYYIKERLSEYGLVTIPNFDEIWIDGHISFALESDISKNSNQLESQDISDSTSIATSNSPEEITVRWVSKDPTYRISKLDAANRGVIAVKPDSNLAEAVTLMMTHDFSQLPVMTTERELKGMISWKSIGTKLILGNKSTLVRDLKETAYEVRSDTSIFDAISLIVQYDYVLVRAEDNRITGIVTASDLSVQFRLLTEPFLLLSEIENLIRNIIGDQFSPIQLTAIIDVNDTGREVKSIADLTFGEYIRLLEHQERWDQLNIGIDRKIFCTYLDKVRKIRNDVTHFDPDGIAPEDLDVLRNFTNFMKQLDSIHRKN